MPVLFRREVPIRDVVAVDAKQAHALQSPIRLAMLDLMAIRPMSVDELASELPAHGFHKATNTLRHHLDVLAKANLVELALLEQTRGAVLKYFAACARPLHHQLPDSAQEDLDHLALRLSAPVARALEQLSREEPDRVRRMVASVRRCPRCPEDHYEDLVLLSALNRATVNYLRRPRLPTPLPPSNGGRARGSARRRTTVV